MFAALYISRVLRETLHVYKKENEGSILHGGTMSIGVNNHLANSRLFSRRNVEVPNGYEDLSVIQFQNNENCDYNEPSTSTAFRPPSGTVRIASNRNLSCIDVRRNNIEESGQILPSSVRSTTFINGSVRRDNGISNQDVLLSSNNLRNMSTLPRTFGLSSRSSALHSDLSQWNNGRVNQDSNFRSSNNYVNMSSEKRTFGLGLRNGALSGNTHLQKSLTINHNVNSTICRTSTNHINMSQVSTNYGPPARNIFTSELQTEESIQCNEGDTLNQTFRKPTLSRVLKCRNLAVPPKLFSHQNVDKHSRDFSNINGFNVTHIMRRDQDTFSESRFPVRQQTMLDNQSMAGSFFSMASVKSQFINLLENLHHSMLNIAPNIPADVVRMEFDKAKEVLENINGMSYAPTIRETDAASVISHSSKVHYSTLPDKTLGTMLESKSLLKSGKEVLKSLGVRTKTRKNSLLLSQVSEEERTVIHATEFQDELSDDGKEDSALIFKKPKTIFREKKAGGLRIRTPQVMKNLKAKIRTKIINLKEWYPVAVGRDLAFCGTDDGGTAIQTEPVKKRLTNRKLALVNGLECNLVGNPSNCIVSVFPKQILTQLQNGLTPRWKVLQDALQKVQNVQALNFKRPSRSSTSLERSDKKTPRENKENTEIYESTPRTRRKIPEKQKGEDESHPTPVKVRSPIKTATVKEKGARGRAKKNKVSPDKKEKILKQKKKSESPKERETSPQKEEKGAVPQTRSGRTVKPPSKFWLVPGAVESEVADTPRTVAISDEPRNKKSQKKVPPSLERKKSEKSSEPVVESTIQDVETPAKKAKVSKGKQKGRGRQRTDAISDEPRDKKSQKKELQSLDESSGKKPLRDDGQKEPVGVDKVHSSTEDAELRTRKQSQAKRKREVVGDADSTSRKRSKSEKSSEPIVESTIEDVETPAKKAKVSQGKQKGRGRQRPKTQNDNTNEDSNQGRKGKSKETNKKKENKNSSLVKKDGKDLNDFEDDDFELQLDDIEIPEMTKVSSKPQLNRSLLKLVSMETPPLKYFNNNLRIKKMTPEPSPDWCISQRTKSEVKQFQLRRAQAHKRKPKTTKKKEEKTKNVANKVSKDLKSVLNWVAEKEVRTPVGCSQVLKYVIPSRKQMEESDDEEEEEEEFEM